MKKRIAIVLLASLSATTAFAGECASEPKITKQQILAAQKAWGDGIVAIGAAKDHERAASDMIDTLYAYDLGPVLFKPTKAAALEFRDTKEEALSYFVTGKVPEDKGFALAPYSKVRFDNKGIVIDCNSALAQGNYYFTKADGSQTKVDYSFGYVTGKDGSLKINLHHSSLPYTPQ